MRAVATHLSPLKDRAQVLLIAAGTNVMGWVRIGYFFFEAISKNARGQRVKRVAFLCTLPFFFIHCLLFQLIFFLNDRRIKALEMKSLHLEIDNGVV